MALAAAAGQQNTELLIESTTGFARVRPLAAFKFPIPEM
jgi:hypothetical protein